MDNCFTILCWFLPYIAQLIKNLPAMQETPVQFLGQEESLENRPSSVQFSHSVMSDSLQHHGLQHSRLPCPSPSPRVCSNSCPLSQWCHPTISSSVIPFSSCPQSFLASGSFPKESALHIRWPKYWSFSFSISPSNEYSGFFSFRIDWFDLAVQKESSSTPQFESISSLALSLLYGPTFTSIRDY